MVLIFSAVIVLLFSTSSAQLFPFSNIQKFHKRITETNQKEASSEHTPKVVPPPEDAYVEDSEGAFSINTGNYARPYEPTDGFGFEFPDSKEQSFTETEEENDSFETQGHQVPHRNQIQRPFGSHFGHRYSPVRKTIHTDFSTAPGPPNSAIEAPVSIKSGYPESNFFSQPQKLQPPSTLVHKSSPVLPIGFKPLQPSSKLTNAPKKYQGDRYSKKFGGGVKPGKKLAPFKLQPTSFNSPGALESLTDIQKPKRTIEPFFSKGSESQDHNPFSAEISSETGFHGAPVQRGGEQRVEFQMHGHKGPESYKFGYDTGKGHNRHFRYEERDHDGKVKGHYGFYDQDGKMSVINYEADPHTGYHAGPASQPYN